MMKLWSGLFRNLPFRILILIAGLTAISLPGEAQTNSWTNPASGQWEDLFWSLGILPSTNQTVQITNANSKAVSISATTVVGFPQTMTITNLAVSGPPGTFNTLLLNFASLQLNVLNDCTIGTNGRILNLSSLLLVGNDLTISNGTLEADQGVIYVYPGEITIANGIMAVTNSSSSFLTVQLLTNASFVQVGGTVDGWVEIQSGEYDLRGGLLSGLMIVGDFGAGSVTQYSGTVQGNVILGFGFDETNFGTGSYVMYDGQILANAINLGQPPANQGYFDQEGGVVTNQSIFVDGNPPNGNGVYSLHKGTLISGNASVGYGEFDQYDGRHIVIDDLGLSGFSDDGSLPSGYMLAGGFLNCGSIDMFAHGDFLQSGGTNSVGGRLYMNRATYDMTGGMLSDSNLYVDQDYPNIPTKFIQASGLHHITNMLTCFGYYELDFGTLIAPVISLHGTLSLGPSPAVVTNVTSFTLIGGTLQLSNTTQQLAPLTLSGNGAIEFLAAGNKLTFADSSGQTWTDRVTLVVSNWNGSTSGGGEDQLFFGSSANGLTAAQVREIQFINPASLPAGTWSAKILPTGEVVPAVPSLTLSLNSLNPIIAWPSGNFILQATTNLSAPFVDISTSPPFTNDTTQFPSRFFRLRELP